MTAFLGDKTGNHNDFSLTAGTVDASATIPTVTGNTLAADFSISSKITCINDFTSIDGGDISIECWIKQKGAIGDRTIADKGGTTGLQVYIQNNDTAVFAIDSTSGATTATFTDTTNYMHLGFVYRKTNGQTNVYHQGTFVETISSLSMNGLSNNASALFIQTPADNGFFIDEYRIWNTARTDQNIADNYNIQLTGTETGLIVYLQFQEDTSGFLDLTSKRW